MKKLIALFLIIYQPVLASGISVDPNLKTQDFAGITFIPFIYNLRTNAIHWAIGNGAQLPNGQPHPLAAPVRGGVHGEIFAAVNPQETRDWGGGGFNYNPETKKLIFSPTAGMWSLGKNSDHWQTLSNGGGILPWQYIDTSMEAAVEQMGVGFEPNENPQGNSGKNLLDTLKSHHAFPKELSEAGQLTLAVYLEIIARDPEKFMQENIAVRENRALRTSCSVLLQMLTDAHPTRTPAILGRGRLGTMVLQ